MFTGVALVDILANGVAMLIIVIVLSIAARTEREQHYAEQEGEVSAVMTRQFSTSLVLNRLAASPPARLHDYDNSPLDQALDPDTLPIIELHRDYVREYYTGAIWTRRQLLEEDNSLDAWLAGFDVNRQRRLRVDLYDVGQFYITMSILRAHGMTVGHWHFLPGIMQLAQARACPPGVPAKDCLDLAVQDEVQALPRLPRTGETASAAAGDWLPQEFAGGGHGGVGSVAGPMPGGATLGRGVAGGNVAGAAEGAWRGLGPYADAPGSGGFNDNDSFPNATGGWGSGRGSGIPRGEGQGEGQGQGRIRLRLALPETLQPDALNAFDGDPAVLKDLAHMLGAIMHFLSQAQQILDAGGSPVALLGQLVPKLTQWLEEPPALTDEQFALVHFLSRDFEKTAFDAEHRELRVYPLHLPVGAETRLLVRPNRLLERVQAGRSPEDNTELPGEARATLSLNAFPGIWRGLQVDLERDAVLLMPPEQQFPDELRWRAAAYISPTLDDYIIGFVYADLGPAGILQVQADSNRVRLGGQQLITTYHEALLGAKGWLVVLYTLLVGGLLLLFLLRRYWVRPGP